MCAECGERHQRRAAKEQRGEHGIENGIARQTKDARVGRQEERGKHADRRSCELDAEPPRDTDEGQSRERWYSARRALRRP